MLAACLTPVSVWREFSKKQSDGNENAAKFSRISFLIFVFSFYCSYFSFCKNFHTFELLAKLSEKTNSTYKNYPDLKTNLF